MRKLILSVLSTLGLLALSPVSVVSAADLIVDDVAVYDPATSDWTGMYVGAFGGWHAGTVIEYFCVGAPGPGCSGNFPLNGLIGGLDAGVDYQLDTNWVVGGFVQLPLLKPTGSVSIFGGFVTFNVEPQLAVAGGVRAGYAIDNFLPYGFVGGTVVSNRVSTDFGVSSTATHVGLTAGAGLEAMVAENVSIDGRYTYSTLSRATYNWGVDEDYGENAHNFTLGAHFRF